MNLKGKSTLIRWNQLSEFLVHFENINSFIYVSQVNSFELYEQLLQYNCNTVSRTCFLLITPDSKLYLWLWRLMIGKSIAKSLVWKFKEIFNVKTGLFKTLLRVRLQSLFAFIESLKLLVFKNLYMTINWLLHWTKFKKKSHPSEPYVNKSSEIKNPHGFLYKF